MAGQEARQAVIKASLRREPDCGWDVVLEQSWGKSVPELAFPIARRSKSACR